MFCLVQGYTNYDFKFVHSNALQNAILIYCVFMLETSYRIKLGIKNILTAILKDLDKQPL